MEGEKIEYDRYGRMKYNREFHPNNGKKWSKEELRYLVDWYDKIGADEMSFALGRTITTIAQKVNQLRKLGIMSKAICGSHRRVCNKKF